MQASETTDDIKKASLSELMAIFSTVCYCDIISDYITMETVSCDDSVLTMSSDFTFSDEDGIMTASTLLSAAANVLIGERILDNITLLWDTSCPLRDVQGNCIEVHTIIHVYSLISYNTNGIFVSYNYSKL